MSCDGIDDRKEFDELRMAMTVLNIEEEFHDDFLFSAGQDLRLSGGAEKTWCDVYGALEGAISEKRTYLAVYIWY